MKRNLLIPALVAGQLLLPALSFAFGGKPASPSRAIDIPNPAPPLAASPGAPEIDTVGAVFRERFVLSSASEKLVDNQGNGHEALYGVRNFRAVLNGVYYRGGANNYYNKHKKRSNMNPLPNEGLTNLCQQGFGQAVYLYSTNFSSAPKATKCKTIDGNENTLEYLQVSPLDFKKADLDKMHSLIFDHIRNPRLGPIYAHCWNGWHSSGYVAATALRQFCDFTADQAVAYWNINTDGNNGTPYNGIRNRIKAFVPNPNLSLSPEEKAALCPAPGSLSYLSK